MLLVALSSSVGNLVAPDRVRSLCWNMDARLGGSQLRAELVGRLSRARTSHYQTFSPSRVIRRKETIVGMSLLPRLDAVETPHLPCLDGQVLFPGVTHRAIKRYQKVRMQSWRTARSLIRLRSTGRSEQTTNCVKFSRTCQMNTNRSLIYGDSLKAKMQSLDDEKVALLAAKRQFLPLQSRIEKQKNTWSEYPGRLRRNNNIVWKFYKNGSRLTRNWMQHTPNRSKPSMKCRFWLQNRPQKMRRLSIRAIQESSHSHHFPTRPRRTTDHPLSVQICSLDAKHGVPQRC